MVKESDMNQILFTLELR